MKKLIISVLALAVLSTAPAHAINRKYAEQLERSGCTQVTDGNGCDIHKSKAWNQAHMPKQAAPKQTFQEMTAMAETMPGMNAKSSEGYLTNMGFKKTASGDWKKNGHTLRVITEKGLVANAQFID